MTPPDDRSGQYGVPYPGTGHDAFGAPGVVGHGQQYDRPHGQQYGQQQYGQPQHQYGPGQGQYGQYSQPQPSYDAPPAGYPAQDGHLPGRHTGHGVPGQSPDPGYAPAEDPGHVEEFEDDHDSGPLIRPFAMTGGRTRPRYELALEALVSASVDPQRLATLLPEHQRICTLCTEVKSVAEVSALLSLPLGVARILVADLAEAGLVAIHQPASGGESGNQPDVTLLERVLSGLRKL
ncbi:MULTISPECIES: DUF742 domain-containing protein [unclassified Kitasatospora]|uniref:DUF742 domain-containing protein n=1 Tax=unclassified Kitasatospora TaxID=2633591 RepID=UPI001ADF94AC|nr:DUF742 domain-containing protein [Kitasatospora sp. RG8]MBP0449762.1 DUF742 domain-containing protein [Kitasatospora sp. RG8]